MLGGGFSAAHAIPPSTQQTNCSAPPVAMSAMDKHRKWPRHDNDTLEASFLHKDIWKLFQALVISDSMNKSLLAFVQMEMICKAAHLSPTIICIWLDWGMIGMMLKKARIPANCLGYIILSHDELRLRSCFFGIPVLRVQTVDSARNFYKTTTYENKTNFI